MKRPAMQIHIEIGRQASVQHLLPVSFGTDCYAAATA
jgi:hypothetical protein